jgi:hypothetical protein
LALLARLVAALKPGARSGSATPALTTVRLKEVDQCGISETVITTFTNPNTPAGNIWLAIS